MTFRFVLQNKNALLLTVLEIERTIYTGSSALGDGWQLTGSETSLTAFRQRIRRQEGRFATQKRLMTVTRSMSALRSSSCPQTAPVMLFLLSGFALQTPEHPLTFFDHRQHSSRLFVTAICCKGKHFYRFVEIDFYASFACRICHAKN